ncbi:MAG: hypothetical protein J6S96_05525 [Muribaculaceae bacterium]|nr:hypothetical protein [Muribaculaceae bacterium]
MKEGIATPIQLDEVELVGTEEVLKEILRSARQQPVGSKERAELYAKYNDIKKESEQESSDETDTSCKFKCKDTNLKAIHNLLVLQNFSGYAECIDKITKFESNSQQHKSYRST